MKKITLFLIALFTATFAFADKIEINGLYYDFNTEYKTATVSGGDLTPDEVIIPSSITYNEEEYTVTKIGSFYYNRTITSITIPATIVEIQQYAFENSQSISSVYIFDIAAWCNIEMDDWGIDFTNPMHNAENCYLNNIKLEELIIPDGVDSIKYGVFHGLNVKSITIPNSVTYIGEEAFSACKSLESITIPNSITTIEDATFHGCSSLTSITIPNSVTTIGSKVFFNCSALNSIVISDNITKFGEDVFTNTEWFNQQPDGCLYINNILCGYKGDFPENETQLNIAEGTKCIAASALYDFSSLTSVNMPNSVMYINDAAFGECVNLKTLKFSDNLKIIEGWAFAGCTSLTSINIPQNVTFIGDWAFGFCSSLEEINISTQKADIHAAFHETQWYNNHPNGCMYLNTYLYSYKGMMPEGIHIDIKEGTTSICYGAFTEQALKSITIPSTVNLIGDYAFDYCQSLETMTLYCNIPPQVNDLGSEIENCKILVPEGSLEKYKNHKEWGKFIDIEEFKIPETPTNFETSKISSANIYTTNGTLHIDGLVADYQIYNMSGQLVYIGKEVTLQLPRGIYLITINGEVEKIVL